MRKQTKTREIKIAVFGLLTVIALLFGNACAYSDVQTVEERDDKTSMFVSVEATNSWEIVYHKETGVMYAVSMGRDNYGTFTPLINADGTPMIYEAEEK